MRRSSWIECGALLPKSALFSNLFRDLFIIPFSDRMFRQKTEVNSSLTSCDSPKLARLLVLTPQRCGFCHLPLCGSRIMQQRISLQQVIAERMRDSPCIA
jgi:hypothetical protein